jgi:Glycosyl hydrolase family 12
MKRSLTLAFVGAMLVAACDNTSNSGSPGSGASSGSQTTTGSGTGAVGAGGASPGSGPSGAGPSGASTSGAGTGGVGTGTSGAGGSLAACSNTDKTIIPIDSTGWVPRNCDDYGIQGAWYCYTDGYGNSSCMTGTPPYAAASPGPGMCISGTTASTTTTPAAYGAAVGFSLNDSGGTNSVKSAYDATTYNITGFNVTIAGATGGLPVRIGFTGAVSSTNPAPFVEVPGAGTYAVKFSSASVPATWMVPNAGATVDPTSIFDLQFQLAAGATAESYDFCITSLSPILSTTSSTTSSSSSSSSGGTSCGALAPYGSQQCGGNGDYTITDLADYGLQNDFYNGSGSQCLSAMQGGDCAGFTVTPSNVSAPTSGSPASYPSLIYGWHYGGFHGGYQTAKQLSAIASVPTTWSFSTASGTWDASYDIWLNPNGGNPANPGGGLELMVWADHQGATPVGSQVATAQIGGITWAVWKGNVQNWAYLAYVAASGTTNGNVDLDLKAFFNDAATRNVGLTTSWYLLGVESGFELWSANSAFKTNSLSVSVN